MIYNPTREQARQFFIDAWRKHRERLPPVSYTHLTLPTSDLV